MERAHLKVYHRILEDYVSWHLLVASRDTSSDKFKNAVDYQGPGRLLPGCQIDDVFLLFVARLRVWGLVQPELE